MKKRLLFPLLILFLIGSTVQNASAKNVLRGTLLKSNSKPLTYTEIELVPVNSHSMINDRRLTTISVPSGKFSFINVPDGEYTLSINFGEKPTELSPYSAFFFPETENRKDAQAFQFTGNSLVDGVVFRLPPSLVQQKVIGKVENSSGYPMADVYVNLRDLEFNQISFTFDLRTNKNGEFSLKGFRGRRYEVVVIVPLKLTKGFEPLEVIARGKSAKFTLDAKTPSIIVKVKLPDEENLYDTDAGKLF